MSIRNRVINSGTPGAPPPTPTSDAFIADRAVMHDRVQSLSTEAKARARANIGVGEEGGVGTDLSITTHGANTFLLVSSTGSNVTIPSATTSLAGLLTAEDKTKLDGIAAGATAGATWSTNLSGIPTVITNTTASFTTADESKLDSLVTFPGFGISGTTACVGNDSRLSDARTPVAHNQAESTITFTDIVTGNASPSAHGYLIKLENTGNKYLRDDGTWQVITGAAHDALTLNASVADIFSLSTQELQADDPNADSFVFWDDSAGKLTYATFGAGLTMTGTVLSATTSSGDFVGPAGGVANNEFVLFSSTTGKAGKGSGLTFASGVLQSTSESLTLKANAGTSGKVFANSVSASLESPTDLTYIFVADGALSITVANSNKADFSSAGFRLGGSGARVTTILDEDNMASNSATTLATQQSIKAYVDALDNRTANRRVAVVGDIVADAPTGYDTIEVLATDDVLVIPAGLAGFGGYLLLDAALRIGTRIINETAITLLLIDSTPAGYIPDGIPAKMSAVVTDGTSGAWRFAVGHPATTTRTDGNPAIIAPITKNANFTISEAERGAQILLTKTGSGQVITLPNTGISVGWTQTYCRATSQAISFAGAGTLLGSDIASVTENKWFGLSCIATGTYRFV